MKRHWEYGLLLAAGFALVAGPLEAQETKLPTADAVNALQGKYRQEREAAIKTGVAKRFQPALLERADALAAKGAASLKAGRLSQSAEAIRQARWQLPYQAPATPTEHISRIIGSSRLRHGMNITAIAYSADGQRLATASFDQTVKLWDLGNGHELLTYTGHDHVVSCVAFSPDGTRIASAGRGPLVKVWNPADGKDILTLKPPALAQDATALAFSRDGKIVVASYGTKPGEAKASLVVCFDAKTGGVKRTDDDFRGRISSLSFTADGDILAAGVADGQVRLWHYPAMIENPKLPPYWIKQHNTGAIYAVAFSPDGKTLVCSGPDSVKLYATPQPGATFKLDNPRITLPSTSFSNALAFSRDGKSLFTGSLDGLIRFWDPENGQMIGSFKGHAGDVRALAFNPGGNQLASAGYDSMVRLWDFDIVLQARDVARHDGPIWSAVFSPDGDRVLTASADRTARVWEMGTGKELLTLAGHNAPVTAAMYGPDGKLIATVGSDKALRIWDAVSGAPLRLGEGHTGTITSLDFSADSKQIVTGGADRRIKVWDAGTAKEILSIDDNLSLVASVAFRPDGKQIAVGNVDQTICLFDAMTGKLQHKWIAHGISVNCVAYSPNGQLLASGGNDTLVKVWPLATPGDGAILFSGHSGPISGLAFRKDNQHLASASADQLVKLWRIEGAGGKEVQTFRGHKDWVTSVAFNSDGFYLVSGSVDRSAKVWEITSREAPLLAEHTSGILTVAVSSDGKQLASGSLDRTIKIWDLATGAELATLHGHNAAVSGVIFVPGAKMLVSSGHDRTIRLWDTALLKEIPKNAEQERNFSGFGRGSPYMAVTPDTKRLLAWFPINQANFTTLVECFELQTGKRLFSLKETNRRVLSLSIAANGKLAATGATDGSVRLWKVDGDQAEMSPGGDWSLFTPSKGRGGTGDVALSADGTVLVVTSDLGEVKIVDPVKREVLVSFTAHKDASIFGCLISPDGKQLVTMAKDNTVKCWSTKDGKQLRQWVMGPPTAATLVRNWAFTPDSRHLVTGNSDTTLFVLDLP
jgi:WD40 repeat protein